MRETGQRFLIALSLLNLVAVGFLLALVWRSRQDAPAGTADLHARVRIVDEGKIYSTINLTDTLKWPSSDIRNKAGSVAWNGWKPKYGDEGTIVGSALYPDTADLIHILRVGDHYVPVAATGIEVITEQGKERQAKSDKERLQRAWKVVYAQRDGRSIRFPGKPKATFSEDKLVLKGILGQEELKAQFVLDERTSPKAITLTVEFRGDTGRLEGIYSLENDVLQLCLADRLAPRPAGFTTQGTKQHLLVFTR